MNNFNKVILSILGGIDVTFYIISPILISILWVNVFYINKMGLNMIYAIGLFSSIFRGIKVGWLK